MTQPALTRRQFFTITAQAARNSCFVLSMPAILAACDQATQMRLNGTAFNTLTEVEANELDAIAARIMPTDETPGAREAGVVYFIDTVLGNDRDQELAMVRNGLTDLQEQVRRDQGVDYFFELSEDTQDGVLRNIEDSTFFGAMKFLTVAGMFSLPEYGGNQNRVGYQVIGFDDRHAWAPPFGYYDANANGGGQ